MLLPQSACESYSFLKNKLENKKSMILMSFLLHLKNIYVYISLNFHHFKPGKKYNKCKVYLYQQFDIFGKPKIYHCLWSFVSNVMLECRNVGANLCISTN